MSDNEPPALMPAAGDAFEPLAAFLDLFAAFQVTPELL
jgi:hypothetical protein